MFLLWDCANMDTGQIIHNLPNVITVKNKKGEREREARANLGAYK